MPLLRGFTAKLQARCTIYRQLCFDRATSGVVLLGASKGIVAALGAQFMARTIQKRYLAIVRGHLDDAGTVDHPLDAPGKPEPKDARTHYRTLARRMPHQAELRDQRVQVKQGCAQLIDRRRSSTLRRSLFALT